MIRWQRGRSVSTLVVGKKNKKTFFAYLKTSGPNNSQVKTGQNQNINQELHPPDAKLLMHVLLPVPTFNILAINSVLESSDAVRSYKWLAFWISVSINDTGLVTDLLEWIWQAGATSCVHVRNTKIQLSRSLPPRKLWIFSWRQDIRQRALTQTAADVCLSRGDNFQWSRGCN